MEKLKKYYATDYIINKRKSHRTLCKLNTFVKIGEIEIGKDLICHKENNQSFVIPNVYSILKKREPNGLLREMLIITDVRGNELYLYEANEEKPSMIHIALFNPHTLKTEYVKVTVEEYENFKNNDLKTFLKKLHN